MSIQLVKTYQREIAQVKDLGATNEMALKRPFANLLYAYCQKKNLTLVEEISMKSALGNTIRPDGTVKGINRLDWGYWEAKDEADELEDEVKKKFAKGYPKDNIIFEDTETAVLYQNGIPVYTAKMQDKPEILDKLLTMFISFERPEYRAFREAIESFKDDVPSIIKALRKLMDEEAKKNQQFVIARNNFLQICQDAINPDITKADIREMIVQHILTEDIFTTIFEEADFHRYNNIATELETVIATFFNKEVKKNFFNKVRGYYQVIKTVASKIDDTREKQTFLKVIYEDFYKAYNPKGADKLGIVYTPNEIVRFMIESTDYLLYEHFGKELLSKDVEILDPATGTGTFITDLIDYFPSSKKEQIKYKYENEIHANEVSILPYYIANLNIEFAYQQKMGTYKSFENIVFVDTLDNMGFNYEGKQGDMFTSISTENLDRIKKQNRKKISVIIGNPPYNANQQNENDNNKNREYPEIDKRIKETYIKESTAQKSKVYDMYSRFFRWAMDRIDKNGVIAFITNRSFIESRTFDGFRKCVKQDFDHIYIIDTQSDVRANPKIAGTTHNVFGIQTGVAIMFLVKNSTQQSKCRIDYFTLTDEMKKEDKLDWLRSAKIQNIPFKLVTPDKNHNWLNLTDNDFEELIPVIDKKEKNTIFEFSSLGVNTARDEWVYGFDKKDLQNKAKFFIDFFLQEKER
ncbi:MAG: N-6 DNA methylase [Bernardetiaceae bacterium]|nr:N-6 DNA methylase [Bernardetiaceae bacterium]